MIAACGVDSQLAAVDPPIPPPVTAGDPLPVSPPSSSDPKPEPTAEEVATFLATWQASEWQAAAAYAITVGTEYAQITAQTAATAPPRPAPAYRAPARPAAPQAPTGAAPGGFLSCVRQRESRGSYTVVNSSSGAGGAYQFLPSTWQASGAAARTGAARAEQASPAQQDAEAQRLYASQGRSPWAGPGC
jgi:hypothetical protein